MIATNTIAQGDTRASGLTWIVNNRGTIFSATKRLKWPGQAAVVVSVVHIIKSNVSHLCKLDGRRVEQITSFLFHAGGNDDPLPLAANAGKSFQGSIVLGMGFTFDDTDKKGVANTLEDMRRLIEKDPRNAERIFPYIGGEEINDSPTHAPRRYVINFDDMPLRRDSTVKGRWATADEPDRKEWRRSGVVPEDFPGPVAADWPDILSVVDARVRPERQKRKPDGSFVQRKPLPQRWWQYAEKRPGLTKAMSRLDEVIVVSRVGEKLAFAVTNARMVFAESTVVFPLGASGYFALLQSRVHECWARFFASSMKDDLRYAPSDCFETFAFPRDGRRNIELSGRTYLQHRTALMVQSNEGLTKTYNRFHDPDERSPDFLRIRELHAAMDRAVLDAYGWNDIPIACEFILDYEDEDDETSRRKKPWRYRWPDEVRDEVLARLLKLNGERAREEELTGLRSVGAGRRRSDDDEDGDFGEGEE